MTPRLGTAVITAGVAVALAAGSAPAPSVAAPSATRSCAAPLVAFSESSAQTLAPGVTAIAGQVGSGAGRVDIHAVRADLSQTALRVLGRGATGSIGMADALAGLPNGIAAVNGDLFHVTPDGSSVAPDGPQADRGALVKGGAGEADALVATDGVAAVTTPRFDGTVTITAPPPGDAGAPTPASTATPSSPVAAGTNATSSPPATATHRIPARASHRRLHRKHRVTHRRTRRHPHRGHRHRGHRHRRHHRVAHPTHQPPGSVVIVPAQPSPSGAPAPPSAIVTLDGVNDVDGGTTAILVTPSWGPASLADQLPAGMVEVLSDGATVTAISSHAPVVPNPGDVALLLSAAARKSIPWLAVGDRFAVKVALTTPLGPAGTAIGGNARLVGSDVVDPACSFLADGSQRPRVAAGVSAKGHTLLLVVTDGDTPDEPGLTLGELGSLMRTLGADDALNLDGGQSSTLDENVSGQWHEVNNGPGERWVANLLALVPR